VVRVIKNPISDKINLAKVSMNDEVFITGGILCEVTDETMKLLSSLTNKQQWDWLISIQSPMLFI
jgi:hypothetical protein